MAAAATPALCPPAAPYLTQPTAAIRPADHRATYLFRGRTTAQMLTTGASLGTPFWLPRSYVQNFGQAA